MRLLSALQRFLTESSQDGCAHNYLVAYSGGPDSTALLWGLSQLREAHGLRLRAGHVDHGLDPASGERAEHARALCERLDVPITVLREPVGEALVRSHGLEAAARRVRYEALERLRLTHLCTLLLTAHHRDDQIETVLLRLAQGSGWAGLAGMAARQETIARPLLELRRCEMREAVSLAGLEPAVDPTNLDLKRQRNRLRHELLPYLVGRSPRLGQSAQRVAAAAAGARRSVNRRLGELLGPVSETRGAHLDLTNLRRLPPALLPAAVALLHRVGGADYPPPAAATAELARQLAYGRRIGSDCGAGWRWEADGERLWLTQGRSSPARFTYNLAVPGVVNLAELSLRLRIERAPVAAWMFQGQPTRTGLGPALRAGDAVVVRNRRPGDRVRPLGCDYTRRLKEVLIDRRIPRAQRDRLPLVCVGDSIAWVPGVTIGDAYRIGSEEQVWLAELEAV